MDNRSDFKAEQETEVQKGGGGVKTVAEAEKGGGGVKTEPVAETYKGGGGVKA